MPRKSTDALFAAVYRKPSDLEVRQVLADALLEKGDKRGELLVLQLARALKTESKPTRREQALLKAHGAQWLGRLSKYLEQPKFEAGFVVAATTRAVTFRAGDGGWPEWSTIRELTVGKGSPVALLGQANLESLEAVDRISAADVSEVLSRTKRVPYKRLGIRAPFSSPIDINPLDALVAVQAGLPTLTALEVKYPSTSMGSTFPYFGDLKGFFTSKLFERLRSLSFGLEGPADLNSLLKRVATSKLHTLVCAVENDGVTVTVDVRTKRLDVPTDLLEEVTVPPGFVVRDSGPSKASLKAARSWEKLAKEQPEVINPVLNEDSLWNYGMLDELAARGFITQEEAESRKAQARLDNESS